MRAILFGSVTWKENPLDYDLLVDQEFLDYAKSVLGKPEIEKHNYCSFLVKGKHVEMSVPEKDSAFEMVLKKYYPRYLQVDLLDSIACQFECVDELTTLALMKAHLILPNQWEKHIQYYVELKKKLFIKEFNPEHYPHVKDLYQKHRAECLAKAKAHPKLNQMKDNFFEEAEFKIFDHDSIHKAIARGPVPAYTLMQEGEVWCSKKKWSQMTKEEKLNCVIEEASVLALERSIIPSLFLNEFAFRGVHWAFKMAMQKICTTITSGWFREHCIEAYQDAIDKRHDIVKCFFDGVRSGQVICLKPEIVYGKSNKVCI